MQNYEFHYPWVKGFAPRVGPMVWYILLMCKSFINDIFSAVNTELKQRKGSLIPKL
jgi:hypothetical protein